MKTKDKTNMTVRQEPPRNSFREVHRNDDPQAQPEGPDADTLVQEVDAEEAELNAVQQGLEERKQQIAAKKAQAAEAVRREKLEKRTSLLEDAADWREIAQTSTDATRAKDFFRKAKDAEFEATQLGAELNLNDPAPLTPTTGKALLAPLSTNKALSLIVGLFVVFLGLTCFFGSSIAANPMNSMGQSMIANAPIRGLLAFCLTFLSFLVGVFFLRVAFPQFYRLWHNRVDSERTLESLINESPAWAVLACLFGLLFMFMQLFASFYQALYA
ncbi:hypothetical protein GCM10028818_01270 [Spirosoma horti]